MAFYFPCYRNLKDHLGSLDALAECMELSLRRFVRDAKEESDIGRFISETSKTCGVRVDSVDFTTLQLHAAHLYLVGVHQRIEEFLLEFKRDHPNGNAWNFDGDKDRLTKTMDAVGGARTLEFDLCQHYRNVRNAFVHSEVRGKQPDPNGQVDDLQMRVKKEVVYDRLNAPNVYGRSNFDDFILYSRASKKLAADLCRMGRPTDAELAELARQHVISNGDRARLVNNPSRLVKRLAGFLRTKYSLQVDEADRIAKMVN